MPPISPKTPIKQSDIWFNVESAGSHVNTRIDNNGVEGSSIINAVNIDWNEAQLGAYSISSTGYITTTGELLSYISVLHDQISYTYNIATKGITGFELTISPV